MRKVVCIITSSGLKQQEAIKNDAPPIPVVEPDWDSVKKAFMSFAGDCLQL